MKKCGAWILEAAPSETGDFDGQISQLFSHTNVGLDVWASLAKKLRMDIFCGWFMLAPNEGIAVSPETLLVLTERNIALAVDIYAPMDEELCEAMSVLGRFLPLCQSAVFPPWRGQGRRDRLVGCAPGALRARCCGAAAE